MTSNNEPLGPNTIVGWERAASLQYRLRRYLSGASEEALGSRMEDIIANMFTFTEEAKIGLVNDPIRTIFARCLTHLNIECGFRRKDPLQISDLKDLVFKPDILAIFKQYPDIFAHPQKSGIFCRYGKTEFITAFRDNGDILLSPASFYSDDSLDSARKDNEMSLMIHICPHDFDLGRLTPQIMSIAPSRCHLEIDHQKPTDHYIFCVTTGFHIRLFADFKSDSCLIITNQTEFEKRLLQGVQKNLPGWHITFDSARYIDPYDVTTLLPNNEAELFYFKNFKHMYQHEFRLVALPPMDYNEKIDRKLISIGSLSDISELITLPGAPFSGP